MRSNASKLRLGTSRHPLLYEINARVLVQEYSQTVRSPVTLGDLPDTLLDSWADLGLDAVWMMGVWTTGEQGRFRARTHPGLQEEFRRALPDVEHDDIIGSPYAVSKYEVSPLLGGNVALSALRKKLAVRGIALILDYV